MVSKPLQQPLLRRIVIAFVLMTVVVSGVFSLSIVGIVHFIEDHLVSEEMRRELEIVLREDIGNARPPRLDAATHFYASDLPDYPIPPRYARLRPGFSEYVDGDEAYYVYIRENNGQRQLLVQEQHEFEAREQVLFNVVFAGFLLSVALAWGLGLAIARKVIEPVRRLARDVRAMDPMQGPVQPLAPAYADDEVGRLAIEFDAAFGAVQASLDRERLFTADVSHELRTPLMIVSTSCELLQETGMTVAQREQVARVARAADGMRDLVEIFLQLARDKTQQTVAGPLATLGTIARDQADLWRPFFEAKSLSFEYSESEGDAERYNATLLQAVMSNLLRNALHYTETGVVRLAAQARCFTVEDTGAGIPADQQERIFQPFVRGSAARGEGLGLGLSLVKRICESQGWHITVTELGTGGSRFQVHLDSAVVR